MTNRSFIRIVAAALLGAAWATGCATTVRVVDKYDGAPLPRPDMILVHDFAVSPDQVRLDRGLSPRIEEALDREPSSQKEMQIGGQVSNALVAHLVREIRQMGLPAQRADLGFSPRGNTYAVEGQLLSVDEGNRTERAVIGLGLGRTKVEALVALYMETRDGQTLLERLDVDARSRRKPGVAETMGVGGATGLLVASAAVSAAGTVASEAFGADVDADADRAARAIAKELGIFARKQGWIEGPAAEGT